MYELFQQVISTIGYTLETFGVIIIVIGSVRSTIRALRHATEVPEQDRFTRFRWEIGRAMMLGLEFLVAGDIIRTVVVEHTIGDVLGLGLVVLIRTVLVFTIHLEVEGRWPWQTAKG